MRSPSRCASEVRAVRDVLARTEAELRDAPEREHRLLALRGAGAALAMRGDALAGLVASDGRRNAVHRAARELTTLACGGLPLLRKSLDQLLERQVPDAVENDHLWVATVYAALAYAAGETV